MTLPLTYTQLREKLWKQQKVITALRNEKKLMTSKIYRRDCALRAMKEAKNATAPKVVKKKAPPHGSQAQYTAATRSQAKYTAATREEGS